MDNLTIQKMGIHKHHVNFPVKSDKNEPQNQGERYKGRCATFQSAMKVTIIIGQCFGLNPVLGVCDIDTSKLRFTYFSGRCFYTFLTIFGQALILDLFCILKYFKDTDASLSSNTSLVFYCLNTVTTILFLRIATKWPKLCQHISRTEAADPLFDSTLVRNCNISCVVILILAIIEHGLSNLATIVIIADCEPNSRLYETFITRSFPWVYEFVPFSDLFGIITQFLSVQCTFNWNFADLFVISISLYLTSRLEQVNKKIASAKGRCVPSSFWRTVREDYNKITNLVRRIDEVIGSIVFISFANNLFFICLQLLHTLADGVKSTQPCTIPDQRPFRGYELAIYFMYSLIFLILRSMAVSLIASRVNTASKQPIFALYEVPSSLYCIEVQRFIEQIHGGDAVALSGLQFFKVKRGLVLAIAGTIVTYELVLLQFAGVTPTVAPLHAEQ